MSDKKDKGEPIEGMLFKECDNGHVHPIGKFHGFLDRTDIGPQGEVVYEDQKSSSVGGGNPRYSANYDSMNWN